MAIRRFKDFNNIKGYGNNASILPRGGYVAIIKDVKTGCNSRGEYLRIFYDIAEGDQKDFYRQNFESQDSEDRRWKGQFFVNIPNEDGSTRDYYDKKKFKTMTNSFEASNSGYAFDWDEQKFIGLKIGIIIHHKEIEFNNGKSAMVTNVARVCSVDQIRNGNFKVPDDIPLAKKPEPSEEDLDPFLPVPAAEELPF